MSKKNLYLFANWKMYLDYDESNILANVLASAAKKFSKQIKMAVFPSALALYSVSQVLHDVGIGAGAQNVYWLDKGGFTGEISARMYKEAGCDYALIGHSERRHIFNETNHEVREKLEAAIAQKLTPVLCVGETLKERHAGETDKVVEIQLRGALSGLAASGGASLTKNIKQEIIIAYEPVWAIGTGEACDVEEAERMHCLIEKIIKTLLPEAEFKILYGGSVNADNAVVYLAKPRIDGVLVGNASTKLDNWLSIVAAAEKTCPVK